MRFRILCAIFLLAIAAGAQAQGKTTRILVGFPPGQGGSVVLAQLARSPADGSVLTLSALAGYLVNPHLYGNVQYDTLKDFDPVGMVADLPMMLAVNPSVPVTSLRELIDYAKSNPDKLTHSSSGSGTLSHLLMEDFKQRAGIRIIHVPYQGSPRAMVDLIGGNVQVGLDTVTVIQPHVKSGRLRLIAAGTLKRLPAFPDTPTIAESGFPGFEAVAWVALAAPAGTPREIRERISAEAMKAMRSPELSEKLAAIGAVPRPGTPEEFGALLRAESPRWREIVARSGAKAE